MKRAAAGLIVLLAMTLPASRAHADEQVPLSSPWGGSNVNPVDPVTGPSEAITITGRIQRGSGTTTAVAYTPPSVSVTFHLERAPDGTADEGCAVEPAGPAAEATLEGPTFDRTVAPTWKRYTYSADVPFSPDRNGGYRVYVCINGVPRVDTEVPVRLPAPTVTNLVATADGHAVDLSWDDMRGDAPDLSGYRIERKLGDGGFEALKTEGADATTYTDTSLPTDGGEATYQVIALRPMVSDGTPSNSAAATFAAAPTDSSGGGPAPATGGSEPGGGTGSGGGTGNGTIPGTGRPGGGSGTAIQVPRVGTPSRNFFPALLAPPLDDGFSETLPYDLTEEGGDGELAADEPLEALPGRGLAIPLATGLVLGVWALHLRFLARAARPEYEDPIEFLR